MGKFSTLTKYLLLTITLTPFLSTLLAQNVPEKLYFKFDSSGNQYNWASAPGGNNPATLNGLTIGSSGQFGNGLIGNGGSSSTNRLNTGWATSLPSSGWTISFWLSGFSATTTLYYFFGDINASSFRCFTGGVAGSNNLIIRGGGLTDVPINTVGTSPIVIHIVYTGSAVLIYKNGTYSNQVAQSSVTVSGSGPFLIGGYGTTSGFTSGTIMDEFRLYTRALSATEIASTYNVKLPAGGGNAGIRAVTAPSDTFCSGSKTVSVRLKNFHYKPLTSVTINWKVNNTAQTAYNWTGSLATNDSVTVNIGNYNFAQSTAYTIKAYTSSPNGGTDSVASNDTATRSGFVSLPTPSANITTGGPANLCLGDSVLLSTDTGSTLTYKWYKDTVLLSGFTTRSYYANRQAAYKVIVNNPYNCPKTSSTINVKVDTLTTPTITPAGSTTICQGDTVRLDAQYKSGYTYQWKRDGTILSGNSNSYYIASVSGSYKVIVKSQNQGCTDSSSALSVVVNQRPNAAITNGGPTSLCFGDSVELTATAGSGYRYIWKLNSIALTGDTLQTYYAKKHGYYSVEVNNIYNCPQSSSPLLITVDTLQTPTITALGPTTFCSGDSVRINAPTGAGLYYQWKKDGLAITGATKSYFYAKSTGLYHVVVNKKFICLDSSAQMALSVNPRPVKTVTPDGPLTFCMGDSVVFQADTTSGLSYQWKKNGQAISGAVKSSFSAKEAGAYRVVLTTALLCIDSSSAYTVKVNALPTATATPLGPATFCEGDSVRINANISIGLTYKWKLNGVIIPNATKSFYFASKSGDYRVVVTNMTNCYDSSQPVKVTVRALPSALTTPNGSVEICNGDSLVINTNKDTGVTYQWYKNNIVIAGANNDSLIVKIAGKYKVMATNSFSCKKTSSDVDVKVNPRPVAKISAKGPTSFCEGDSVVLTGNQGTGIKYQWYKDGNPVSGGTDSNLTVRNSGLYHLKTTLGNCSTESSALTVDAKSNPVVNLGMDTTICAKDSMMLNAGAVFSGYLWSTGESTQTILVDSTGVGLGNKTVSVKVTSNGCNGFDTIKITFVVCAGIDQKQDKYLAKIYPNPSDGLFTLEFENLSGNFEIRVTDLSGKEQYSNRVILKGTKVTHSLDLSARPEGIYLLQISNGREWHTTRIFVY
jgi:hypothetical protein